MIIVPSAHDSVIRRENALGAPVRSPIIVVVLPCGSSRAERLCDRPTFSAAALAVSAAIDCEHVDARGRELRNASGPEEKKTLERQIKDQDDLINRYQADLTKRGG